MSEFPVKRVENISQWFDIAHVPKLPPRSSSKIRFIDIASIGHPRITGERIRDASTAERVAIIRYFYDLRVGDVGCHWTDQTAFIPFHYAKIKLGDVFDFYTSPDGVLRLPHWSHLKYALVEFLEDDPRNKYHPSRVRAFIEANGMEQIELME